MCRVLTGNIFNVKTARCMKKPRLKSDFTRLTDALMEIKAEAIVRAMTGNAFFRLHCLRWHW
ncbi:hypothetical protein [Paraflavitalea speifideaquila]|uniref:hypothetical protein n=1 Tax=Paraflavitalea speifideaquila TaxID=3076558 RepID=UPI0028E643C7|nr:hypothetical protein [Paraflavitalea speifideiaquila]